MKAELQEMERLLQNGERQQMVDYLMTHRPESRDEMAMYEKLRNKEYEMREVSSEETQKTQRLLNNSPRNADNG